MPESAATSARNRWSTLPKRALLFFLSVDAALVVLYAIVTVFPQRPWNRPLKHLFGLNVESNIPTWYSSVQLLLIGLGLLALTTWVFRSDGRLARLRAFFTSGGVLFCYLSADEAGRVHEQFSAILQSWHWLRVTEMKLIPAFGTQAARYGGGGLWMPVFLVIGIALLVWLWPQIKLAVLLWSRQLRWMAAGFGVLVTGAVVVEGLGTLIPKTASLARSIEVGVEEGLEMVGASLILFGVLSIVSAVAPRVLGSTEAAAARSDLAEAPTVAAGVVGTAFPSGSGVPAASALTEPVESRT